MRTLIAIVAAAALTPALGAAKIDWNRTDPAPASQPMPAADFFRPPLMREPTINASGTELAAIVVPAGKAELLVWDVAGKGSEGVAASGDTQVTGVHWIDDQHLTYSLMNGSDPNFADMLAQVGDVAHVYPIFQHCGSSLIGIPADDPSHPLFWLSQELIDGGETFFRRGGPVVVANALKPGVAFLITDQAESAGGIIYTDAARSNQEHVVRRFPPVPGAAISYLPDGRGRLGFATSTDASGMAALYRFSGDQWIRSPIDLNAVNIVGPGDEANQLAVVGPSAAGAPRPLQWMDAATGRLGEPLLQDRRYDFNGSLYRDRASRRIVGVEFNREAPAPVWFDEAYGKIQHILDANFKGRRVDMLDTDKNLTVIVAAVYSDRQPMEYYTVELAHRQVGLIKKSRPWIDPSRMRPMSFLRFRTRDGVGLDEYLTLPAGASRDHPVPMIVYPHSELFGRSGWSFQPDVQFLASLGYAVLQPNYRNSDGYQWKTPVSDRWNLSHMADDLSDGARAVLATHLVDPKRIAIAGDGAGGFLALSGAAREPSFYRCAVIMSGISDWEQMIRSSQSNSPEAAQASVIKLYLSDPKRDDARVNAMSPIHFVSQIKGPVFVFHDSDDHNVPIEQSKGLVSALEHGAVPNETLYVSGEGNAAKQLEDQIDMWTRIQAFLAKNL